MYTAGNVALFVLILLVGGSLGVRLRQRSARPAVRRALGAGVLALVVLCLSGALAELVARFVYDRPVVVARQQLREYRPGHLAYQPDLRMVIPASPGWRPTRAATNADGIRSAVPRAARPGERRVMFLGDSWTFGLGLDEHETYPLEAERLLRAQDPSPAWVAINAGIPGYNVFSAVALFEWLAPRYRPRVAVFTVAEHDDVEPDLSDEIQRGDRALGRTLARFALYRFARFGAAWHAYRTRLAERAEQRLVRRPDDPPGLPERLARTAETLARVARENDCRVVFNVVAGPLDPRAAADHARRIEQSTFRAFALPGVRFAFTDWDRRDPALGIPNDGHPAPAGARLLARSVVPAIRAAADGR
ncbi:MAG: hypothetical protein Q8S73_43445 [Deltaproteobacteria bacterium]|nr:hypothetical protein [Deltaproteobacteria bacterium]